MPGNRNQLLCGSCEVSVTKTQGSIMCKICCKWLHGTCANLTDKDLAALKAIKVSSFICAQCNTNLPNLRGSAGVSEDIQNLNKKLDTFITSHCAELNVIKTAIENMNAEMKECLTELKADIVKCNDRVKSVEASVSNLRNENEVLKMENNVLHRRINRSDFLISGLPEGLNDLVVTVIAVAACFNVMLTRSDVNLACYINSKRQILVRLNCAEHRDAIMKQYFKTRSLRVCDIISGPGNEVTSRVYLNDHYTPDASNLNSICNKLRRLNIISKYRILNGDRVKAKITLPDGKEIVRDVNECSLLLNGQNGTD